MVLQTQRCAGTAFHQHPGATYQQQSYSTYQESGGRIQDGSYGTISAMTGHTTPHSNYSQVSTYSSGNSQHHQSGGYHGNGGSHYSGYEGSVVTTGRYESSYHGNSHSHGHNNYGNGLHYDHSPNGLNYGCQKASWTLKNLDDD